MPKKRRETKPKGKLARAPPTAFGARWVPELYPQLLAVDQRSLRLPKCGHGEPAGVDLTSARRRTRRWGRVHHLYSARGYRLACGAMALQRPPQFRVDLSDDFINGLGANEPAHVRYHYFGGKRELAHANQVVAHDIAPYGSMGDPQGT